MTFEEREQILAKDILSVADVAKLLGVTPKTASEAMCNIKQAISHPRVSERGKLHTQDYLDFYRLERK